MILNLSMDDLLADDTRKPCEWPECDRFADGRGFCDKHLLRLKRGRALGAESAEDELAMTALAWAGAEGDAEADDAWDRLVRAACEVGAQKLQRIARAKKGHMARRKKRTH